jgi:transglutaminase-like putative cysteine protease
MDRRLFIKAGTLLPAAAAVSGLPGIASANAVKTTASGTWRMYEVTTQVDVLKPAGVTRVWLPVPLTVDTDYQKGQGNTWSATGAKVNFAKDPRYGAGIVYAEWSSPAQQPSLKLVSRFATREHAVDLAGPSNPRPEDRATLALYTAPTELLPTDGIVRRTAQEITRNAKSDTDKARAIYEWIVENTYRDPKTRGCGVGDIKSMLESGSLSGKCADLNALFVGLARAVGIPARDVYGVRVAKSEYGYRSLGAGTPNISRAQHCRAEFYSAAHGWVPVDPADVRKVILEEKPGGQLAIDDDLVKKARARLFGSWEMNWLAYNYAHDLSLPGTGRGRIGFLMYPNGENAQGWIDSLDPDNFKYSLTAREIKPA